MLQLLFTGDSNGVGTVARQMNNNDSLDIRFIDSNNLDNDPSDEHLENMKITAEKVFEPLRNHLGRPIKINSFYRGPVLN